MTRTIKVAVAAVVLLSFAAPASAATTVTVTDPAGDVTFDAPGYLDIIQAEAVDEGQTLVFRMDLVDPVPASLGRVSPGNGPVWWIWATDTDPSTAPPLPRSM